jgi:DNA-binding FadR family transcriptional regulator
MEAGALTDTPMLYSQLVTGRVSRQIIERIGDAIRSGDLAPGDRLPPERELAERFGVSRVSVRDALRSLEALGLIEVKVGAGGGPIVRAPGAEIVRESLTNMLLTSTLNPVDIAEARLILDFGTVALAASRATEEDLDELGRMLEEARQHLEAGTYSSGMSGKWHLRLAEAAHNPAITLLVAAVRGSMSMSVVRLSSTRDAEAPRDWNRASVAKHEEILAALRDRDTVRAQSLMAEHLLSNHRPPEQVAETLEALMGHAPRS